MTITFRRDDLPAPAPGSAEAARLAMMQRAARAGSPQRQPLASDLRQDAAPQRLSASAARAGMIARSFR